MSADHIKEFLVNQFKEKGFPPYLYGISEASNFIPGESTVYYSGPIWGMEEISSAIEALLTGKWLVSGENVARFEKAFSKYFSQNYSVMVNSGSSANLVMIAAAKKTFGWKDNDEVVVSAVGFPTTIAPIYQNGLTPRFIDIDFTDLNFSIDLIDKAINRKTKAIFLSPVLGNPPDMDALVEIARLKGIVLILDGCDSLGSKWRGKELAEYCSVSSCSFYPAHHITTGEGGMVSSNNEEIINVARSFAWWGRDCYCTGKANLLSNGTCKKRFSCWIESVDAQMDHKYLFSNMGYNFKPLDLQGAIGLEQIKKFSWIHKKRREHKKRIGSYFSSLDGVRVVEENENSETSWFGVPVVCDSATIKDYWVEILEKNKIQTRHYFAGNILQHPGYSFLDDFSNYPNANEVLERVFFIGCSPSYNDQVIDYIGDIVNRL